MFGRRYKRYKRYKRLYSTIGAPATANRHTEARFAGYAQAEGRQSGAERQRQGRFARQGVYDALHRESARKARCDRIDTFNTKDFRALAPADLIDKISAP